MWKTIFEFSDDGSAVKVEINLARDLVGITEGINADFPGHVALTIEGLASIGEAVKQYLSAAEIPCPDPGEWDPLGQGGRG